MDDNSMIIRPPLVVGMSGKMYFYNDVPRCFKNALSLQTIILSVIGDNFQYFMREYNSHNSPIPKYFFEFLQKKYSQELLKTLWNSGNLKVQYLDFVLNVHLKEISFDLICSKSVLKCNAVEAIMQKIIEIGKELTSLSLTANFSSHHLQPVLSNLPNIRKLQLKCCNCDDDILKIVANKCPLLTELNVCASRVTVEGMKHLCFPKGHKLQLEFLNVTRTSVGEEGVLMILKNIPTIQVIVHEYLARSISRAAAKEEFRRNTVLNLTRVEIHDAQSEVQAIADLCPNLKHLLVSSIETRVQLLNCCAFKKLEDVSLCFESGKRSNLCIDPLLKNCGFLISNLSLEHFVLSVDVLVQSCPNLQFLKLSHPTFEEPSDRQLPKLQFTKLTDVKITSCSLSNEDDIKSPAFIIRSSPNLKSMIFRDCDIGTQMEDVILNCPAKLIRLDLRGSIVRIDISHKVFLKYKLLQEFYL